MHRARLKKKSHTAYCDCWVNGPCNALVPGDQEMRMNLFKQLLKDTDFATQRSEKFVEYFLFLFEGIPELFTFM